MKKSIICILTISILSSAPTAANPELSADALEHVFLELSETLSELWANDTVRTSALVAGIAAGMAFVYSRTRSTDESSSASKARTRYAGLIRRKQEIAQTRAKENQKLAAMRAQLGIAQDADEEVYACPGAEGKTRFMSAGALAQILPQFIVTEDKDEEQDGIRVTDSHLKGAAAGATAGVLLMLLYYGKPLKNGILFERLRSLMPSGLINLAEGLPIIGWPVTFGKTILTAL